MSVDVTSVGVSELAGIITWSVENIITPSLYGNVARKYTYDVVVRPAPDAGWTWQVMRREAFNLEFLNFASPTAQALWAPVMTLPDVYGGCEATCEAAQDAAVAALAFIRGGL